MDSQDIVKLIDIHTGAMIETCQELAHQIAHVGDQLRQVPLDQAAVQRFLLCETVLQQQSTMLEQLIVALGEPQADGVLPLTPAERRLWCESVRRQRAIQRCLPLLTLASTLEGAPLD